MAQPEHPLPQEDLPLFLSRTILKIMRATIAINTIETMMLPKLRDSQVIMLIPFVDCENMLLSPDFHIDIKFALPSLHGKQT